MIYLDTSVALAALFGEERAPPDWLWAEPLVSSRLLEYEIMVRAHARNAPPASIRRILDEIELLEMSAPVLARALAPFPIAVRTLDGLHLATMVFLRAGGQTIEIATYDSRLAAAAAALGFELAVL